MTRIVLGILAASATFLCLSVQIAEAQDDPKVVVQNYMASLIHGDWDTAATYWHHDDIRRAHRLGIKYYGAPLKIDCTSPVIPAVGAIKNREVTYGYGEVTIADDVAIVPILLRSGVEAVEHSYYLVRDGDAWQLASPITAHTRGWQHRDTRYVRVFYSDSSLINELALQELDRFVESTSRRLRILEEDLQNLESVKLEYYLCNEDQMRAISGHPVHGMTSFPLDAVITRHLPHYHELVHVLINYRLERPSLHTLPMIQEGLAVALGGRWEKSADVLLQFGAFMIESEIVQLEEVLTNDGFMIGTGSLDVSYAVSGLLVRSLIEEHGISRFLSLYERLSSKDTELNSWNGEAIANTIGRVYQLDWETMKQRVLQFASRHQADGILPGGSTASAPVLLTLEKESVAVQVFESDDDYVFSITMEGDRPECVLTLHERDTNAETYYRSRLFGRHCPTASYTQERFGLHVTSAEAGLYDYATDNLLEKYVLSFDPSEEYWDEDSRVVRFTLAKSALPQALATYAVSLFLP